MLYNTPTVDSVDVWPLSKFHRRDDVPVVLVDKTTLNGLQPDVILDVIMGIGLLSTVIGEDRFTVDEQPEADAVTAT